MDHSDSLLVNSTESLKDIKDTGACSVSYTVSGERRPCYRGRVISTCSPSCQNQDLVSRCESSRFQDWTVLGTKILLSWGSIISEQVYRNVYCAICNTFDGATTDRLTCGLSDLPLVTLSRPEIKPFASISLTLVFDFDPRKGLTVGQHTPECIDGEVYVADENICRPITCPFGFVLDGSNCIPEPSNITAIITGTFSVEPTSQMIDTLYQDQSRLEQMTNQDLSETLDLLNISHSGITVTSALNITHRTFVSEILIECNCHIESLHEERNYSGGTEFEHFLQAKFRRNALRYFLNVGIQLDLVITEIFVNSSNTSRYNVGHIDCVWLLYEKNETEYINDSIIVVSTGKTYTSGMYDILDDAVIVCETDLSATEEGIDDTDLILSIITLTCVGISIICLTIRVLLQFVLKSFRNRPGKLQLQLTLALLLAFVMLILGPFLSHIPDACTSAAILMAYGFLAAFNWMNVIAFDTWLVFRPSAAFSRSDEEQRSLFVHYVVGWGIPLSLVGLSLGMNYSDIDERFRPEFGGSRCWYTQRYAMIIYFGVPMALSILLNTYFYINTTTNLRRAFKSAQKSGLSNSHQNHFKIYVKLFTLMGISRILGFISAFTDDLIIEIICVFSLSLQGLFLFLSFVCKKGVWDELRTKTRRRHSFSSSEKKTQSTSIPASFSNSISQSDSKV